MEPEETVPSIEDACKQVLGEQVYQALRYHLMSEFAKKYDDDKKYNGWTNYETWLINLHLTKESNEFLELSRDIYSVHYTKADFAYRCGRLYKEHYTEIIHEWIETLPYMIKDLTISALQEVDWHSIADHVVDDNYEDEDFISEEDD